MMKNQVDSELAKIKRFQRESWMFGAQIRQGGSPARMNRGSRGKSLQTVAVKRADARECVVGCVLYDAKLANFWIRKSVSDGVILNYAYTNTGTHRNVSYVINRMIKLPRRRGKRGAVDV